MPNNFIVLRLTIKVDMNDTQEKSLARVMLRRLNVMFAKCRPKGGLVEILNGNKLCDAYEGRQVAVVAPVVQKSLGYHFVKPIEKPKPETIMEHSMQPPEIVHEISEG